MSKKESANHPFNAFLTKYCVEMTHLAVMGGAIGKREAAKNLLWLLAWLERDAKANLDNELKALRKKILLPPEDEEIWTIISGIANQLHDAGYFLAAKGIGASEKSDKKESAKA